MTLAPVSISQELETQFKSAVDGRSNIGHLFHLRIQDEEIVIVKSQEGSGNLASDYPTLASSASGDQAAYFLIRVGKASHWVLVTFVPESVGVKEKMVYASAKGHLKDKLGHQNFEDDVHATDKADLSYDSYKGAKNPADSRSEFEKQHAEVLEQEEAARSEASSTHTSVEGIGGYHSVTVPLSESAKRDLNRLKSGEVNFVALSIAEDKSHVDSAGAKMIPANSLSKEIHPTEPRFYLFTPASKAPVFIYCCPEKSAPKVRMVYSTSKNSIGDNIAKLGLNLAPKRVEITDPSEADDELKTAHNASHAKPNVSGVVKSMGGMNMGGMGRGMTGRMGPGAVDAPEMGGQVKAAKTSRVEGEHPIYALINQGKPPGEGSAHKKKIVIPPRAAYYG